MGADGRTYPRFSAALAAKICGYPAETTNLSLAGTQVSLPALRYRLVEPRLAEGAIPLVLELAGTGTFTAACALVYTSDYDDEFLLGLRFETVADEDLERLRAFVAARAGERFLQPEA